MIYHITTVHNWEIAKEKGYFDAPSLYDEGFIHMSQQHQVEGVKERYYKNVENLILLHIDENKLTAPLKYERSPSINENFPHLFGKLNLDAVINTERL